jgi:hypothetical protein
MRLAAEAASRDGRFERAQGPVLRAAMAYPLRGHGDDGAVVELEAPLGLLQGPGDELVGRELGWPRLLHRLPSIMSAPHPTTALRFVRHLVGRGRQSIGQPVASFRTRRSKVSSSCVFRRPINQVRAIERKLGRRAVNRNHLSNIYGKGWPEGVSG